MVDANTFAHAHQHFPGSSAGGGFPAAAAAPQQGMEAAMGAFYPSQYHPSMPENIDASLYPPQNPLPAYPPYFYQG